MPAGMKTSREELFAAANRIAGAQPAPFIDIAVLFGRASNDDLARYPAQMLVHAAARAAADVAAWTGDAPLVRIAPVEGVEPQDVKASVLSIVDRNKPFLYDSVMGEVTSRYRDILLAVHPILGLRDGRVLGLADDEKVVDAEHRVSYIQLHLAPLDEAQATALVTSLQSVLTQVRLASQDWTAMLAALDSATLQFAQDRVPGHQADLAEAVAFLDWLRNDNFTFLGMRDYVYSGEGAAATLERGERPGLGILSDPDVLVLRQGKHAMITTPEILAFLQGPQALIVTKANVKSVVHRRAYMDYIGVKRFDEHGRVTGELRIVGLFTATAYTRSVNHIPLIRAKADKVTRFFGFDPHSHSGRMLQNTLESYPRDDLFQIDTDLLAKFCEQINDLSERPRIRVLPRIDHFDRFVSLIVFVPREEYNSNVREKIGAYFARVYEGHVSAYYPAFPEGGVARVHFIIGRTGGKTPEIGQHELEEAVHAIATRWVDEFEAIAGTAAQGVTLSQAYQEAYTPAEALADLPHVARCLTGAPVSIAFHDIASEEGPALALKIFHSDTHVPLSRRVPLLENLGFSVVSERTFEIEVRETDSDVDLIVLHDMELEVTGHAGQAFDPARRARVEEAFLAVFSGQVDNDGFNRLVLGADLAVREVTVLRAYGAYLRQCGIVYSQGYIADTLNKYPVIAVKLFALFHDMLDPALSEAQRMPRLVETREAIEALLADVPSIDEDRILRRYLNAIDATLRSNYFQRGADGAPKPMLAFKFDPHQLDGLPEPRPFREMFAFGTEVEGVHLRFGKVARGGLRWSDRAQDYRTEVLGLVKAQQVKNAVIVPVGAKGGFFPKQLPTGGSREDYLNAGREAYKTYIRTLLSITDNIRDGEVVAPADTVRLDEDDPYFVVAADKGTATFSDTANGLAREAGFWLDDAFASGGSAGYDHKKMGITARGAWEAVKRHFREMNIDIQTTPFSVVGVGDMSGDVFGNGMLLSRKIRLIAAFDHRDIFIDPDPDTEASFNERQRMFDLPRSSWQDYDRSLLSKGGMIISRAEKSVVLTPEAAAAIGIERGSPFEIMTAILQADVDLLWFGGIGTYVKASDESDTEVGDRANDAIRVTAREVRAKVIGEGANLGVTQKGRIAYSLNGGRCNSDAIDNSAGVNSSDVEVNIKIALAPALADGRLTLPTRDALLVDMTQEVAALVLRNNYLQPLAISLSERKGAGNREELSRLMDALEAAGQLNRKVEFLPDEAALRERYASGRSLTRPEIGVLLSYAKLTLFDALVESGLPDDPYCHAALTNYFPARMRNEFAADIGAHRLAREIIATVLANHVINRGGPGFVIAMAEETGVTLAHVVKAALMVRDGLDLPGLWDEIDRLDAVLPGDVQNDLYAAVQASYTAMTRLLLETDRTEGPIAPGLDALKDCTAALQPLLASSLPARFAESVARETQALVDKAVPQALAARIASLPLVTITPEIMQIRAGTSATLERTLRSYYAVTELFRIDRVLEIARQVPTSDHYDSLALSRSIDQISAARRNIVMAALVKYPAEEDPVGAWTRADRMRINRLGAEIVNLGEAMEPTLSRIIVAAGLLTDLAHDRTR